MGERAEGSGSATGFLLVVLGGASVGAVPCLHGVADA
jgi:hypothetical protein